MRQKTTLRKLWDKDDCWGWAYSCCDKRGKYVYQPDNDLGLFGYDLSDIKVYVTKKVKIVKDKYLYLISFGYGVESDGNEATLPQVIAMVKEAHQRFCDYTHKDKILVKRTGLI